MRDLTHIVIHHSASARNTTTVALIDQWHRARGFDGVGYHFVITSDGKTHAGRHIDRPGAHVAGHNADTIGICVVGDNTKPGERWNPAQVTALLRTIDMLRAIHPVLKVVGHRDLAPTECPGLEIADVLTSGRLSENRPQEVISMTAPAPVPVSGDRPASTPIEGGIRDTIKITLVALLLKYMPAELADQTAALVAGVAAGALTFLGKVFRNWLDGANAPLWLKAVGKLLPF